MRTTVWLCRFVSAVAVCVLLGAGHSHAIGLGDLKDKAKKEAEKKATTPTPPETPPQDTAAPAASDIEPNSSDATPAVSDSARASGDDFQLYTKFDFVPGQKVLYFDDLSGEETGEFPSRWKLNTGVFEVARVGKDPWIMASARGEIAPKLMVNQLPERYTVEFEWLNRTSSYQGTHYMKFQWYGADSYPAATLHLHVNTTAYFGMKDDAGHFSEVSTKKLPASFATGIHNIRIMVTKSSIKCYVDNDRLVNAPRTVGFTPTSFAIEVYGEDTDFEKENMFFRNFRFAEGGKTMREQLDETGHIVTHGIYFDVNSDEIRGESYKTLADIQQMLGDDPSLRLVIEGHTDTDGSDAANLNLSQRRAESVRSYLVENGKIEGARLEAKGHGEGKPIDANTTPEGKANNRRVELAKL